MIGVISTGRYLHTLRDDAALPRLEQQLASVCREPFRRIDRFVQLALLGSGLCARDHTLAPDCAVYLSSGLGPLSENISVQEQLMRDRQLPKPFNFINTLGSSAGFYVARNLGLHGQNFFISRREASFEATLMAAYADFAAGAVQQALVGAVEEVTLPLAQHRQRLDLRDDAVVAEGSLWLLLEARANAPKAKLELRRYAEFTELQNGLHSTWRIGDRLQCALGMSNKYASRLRQNLEDAGAPGFNTEYHNSLEAAWLTDFVTHTSNSNLFVASGDEQRGWRLLHCRT